MRRAQFLGITDDVTVCGCCGRTGLKRTVALEIDDEVHFYGCDCAAKALEGVYRFRPTRSEIETWAINALYGKPEIRQRFNAALEAARKRVEA